MLKGQQKISRLTVKKVKLGFPQLNAQWLLTGEGEMFASSPDNDILTAVAMADIPRVPLYSLTAVAGFGNGTDMSENVEALIPWASARQGDFAIHITGSSMEPKIPNGSDVLVRPYNYVDYNDLEFGRVHVVVTDDDRAMLKVVKLDRKNPGHLLLISYNEDYPDVSIPISSIRRVFLAVAVQAPL